MCVPEDRTLTDAVALAPLMLALGAWAIQVGRALLEEGRRPDVIPAMWVAPSSAGSPRSWQLVPSAERLQRIAGRALILTGGLIGAGPLTFVINQLLATPLLLALGFPKNQWLLWVDLR